MVAECVALQYLLHGAGDGPVPLSQARPCSKHGGAKGQAAKQEVWKYTKFYSIEKYGGISFILGNGNLIFGGMKCMDMLCQNQVQAD